ncbi:UDP-glucose/GDP-mannose dehydrogenase family protein [Candidatus Roizmanbacteria bacterium]|nr:UDP-glucose/GDP-mannose dehydrogenase family protein [Candidatus Roizmanbacteria bacterium]
MTITIVGHGYVGLVTACVFADFGNKVWVIGHTEEKIDRLKKGDPIIYEPGLKELLEKNLKSDRIHFTTDYQKPAAESEIIFITVGTPPKADGEADLSAVFEVSHKIAKNLRREFTVVSCKSTVPVDTNKKIEQILLKEKPDNVEIAVASCPEFLREGTGLHDTLNPDRIVIGSNSKKAIGLLLDLHEPLNGKRVITDLASAELIKYTSNSILATKISFANLISFFCEKTGADAETVLDAVGFDHRIGRIFMDPGVGYGGSCFPKDVKALLQTGKNLGINVNFLQAVEDINEQAKINIIQKIKKFSPGKKIALWGLSFKPNTDDIRFAPSIYIIENLVKNNFIIKAYDQIASKNIERIFGKQIELVQNPYEAVKNADALVIVTEWNEFKQADLMKVKKLMKHPVIFDGRNIYEPANMKKLGFKYFSTGRKTIL